MPVDLNLPTPGQSPNWGQQLNDEIEKLNQSMNQGVFLASDYGVVGDGSADDTASMQNLIDSVPDGSTIVAPPGAVYRSAGWTVAQKSLNLDLSNAHLVRIASQPILTAVGAWTPPVSVSNVVTTSLYSTVTPSSVEGFAVGDMIKVFSHNVIPDARDGGEGLVGRQGEMAVITAISGGDLTVVPPMIDTYNLAVRVSKLQDYSVNFKFATADFEPGAGSGGSAFSGRVMFRMRSLPFPKFEGRVLSAPGPALYLESTYGAIVDIAASNLPQADGYVVGSYSSVSSDLTINANRCRHAYTDGVYPIAIGASNDPGDYGRAMYDRITGASFATTEASWDTHHGGYGHKFYNITATGAAASGAPAFSLRGQAHSLIGCLAAGTQVGYRFHDEGTGTWATSERHYLSGCSSRDTRQAIIVSLSQMMDVRRGFTVTIDGGDFEATGSNPLNIINGRVALNGTQFRYTGQATPATSNLINVGNGELRGSCRVLARSVTSGTFAGIVNFGTLSEGFQTIDLDLDMVLSEWALSNTTAMIRWATARGEVRGKVNDVTTMLPQAQNTQRAPLQVAKLRALRGNESNSSSAFVAITVAEGTNLAHFSSDPVIMMRVRATAARTAGVVYAGAFAGQQMNIYCHTASPSTVTIPHGTSFGTDLGGANVTLSPGQSLRLMWDGTSGVWAKV